MLSCSHRRTKACLVPHCLGLTISMPCIQTYSQALSECNWRGMQFPVC